MLESGLVRTKNTAAICLKNIALYSIAGIMFYIVGYAVMYTDVDGGWIGSFDFLYNPSEAELALLNAEEATAEQVAAVVGGGYSVMSDWFFQMVFVATAASIVSGTLAERIRILPFLIFTVLLSALIYPIQASWVWGGGWLAEMGFSDFAGSTLVHSTGGWAALAGAHRAGRAQGQIQARTGASTRCPARTCRSPRSAPSSSGSAGSASTAARSWRSAPRSTPWRSPSST